VKLGLESSRGNIPSAPADDAALLSYPLTRVVSAQAVPFQEIAEALALDARQRGGARDVRARAGEQA
jgi:hypothetical protein